jgi:hypothetical protein
VAPQTPAFDPTKPFTVVVPPVVETPNPSSAAERQKYAEQQKYLEEALAYEKANDLYNRAVAANKVQLEASRHE